MTHPYLESAASKDIKINKGATFKLAFSWYDDTDTLVAVNSASARMKIKNQAGGTTAASWVSPTNITLSATAPTVTVNANASATAALTAGDYVYDLEIDFGSNDVVRILEGNCTITAEITD